MTDWNAIRGEFEGARDRAYLDGANKGLLPRCATRAAEHWLNMAQRPDAGDAFSAARVESARTSMAALLDVRPGLLAWVKNTSEAINIAANALALQPGDNVLVSEREHWANALPWRWLERRGVEVRLVRHPTASVAVEDYIQCANGRTRAVTASLVFYGHGARLDVAKLAAWCAPRGIRLVVDAIQALGTLGFDFDALGADVVAAGCHKGLLGLAGLGVLIVREELIQALEPQYAARYAFARDDWQPGLPPLRHDARRYEFGNPNYIAIHAQEASCGFLASIGIDEIESRIRHLTSTLIELADRNGLRVLTPRPWPERGAIVAMATGGDAAAIDRALKDAGVIATVRAGEVRASVGPYSNEDDLDRLAGALKRAAR